MKLRAGGGSFRAGGGDLGQQGAPPCYSSLWETLTIKMGHFFRSAVKAAIKLEVLWFYY